MKLKRLLLVLALALSLPSATLAVWPGADVNTTTFDSDTDSPLLARPDWFDHAVKFNQVRNHVSTFAQTVLDDIDAATARATLGAAGTGVANTYTANQVIAKSTPGFSLNDTSGVNFSSLDYIDNGVLIWRAGMRGDLSNEYIIFDEAAGVVRLNIVPGGAATYTGAFDVVGALTDDGVPVATTTDAQTLTNKTLTSPTINNPVINTIKPLVKDHGTKAAPFTLQLDEADMHVIAFSAATTLTIASTLANDRATVVVKNGGFAITLAGIDNDPPTLTNAASRQDFIGLVKSFGKISAVAAVLNKPTI